ncbi:MAG TPA: NADPH:quinone oxidoreductase [Cyanobacteria bacterium UBA11372]|nr:NADPH:quinone oxidoreductase [Cyanobacteria bacterium UBA11372]
MKAMVITAFGGPEVFAESEVDKPIPAKNEILVKVYATSINPADCGVRQGIFGPRVKLPAILGYDVSGVVEAIGESVKDFKVGDEVYYAIPLLEGNGANAEYHAADESIVAKKPANLSHQEAASVPVAGGTAWAALIDRANIKIGQTVLIHGGAGGVGSFAIQIAKAAGTYVYTTCGSYDIDLVKSIGADRAIDYRNENFSDIILNETNGEGVDVCLTTVGGEILARSLMVIKQNGQAVTVTGVAGDLNLAIGKNITIHFVHLDRTRAKLDALRILIERGQIKPVIGMSFPLNQIAEAHKKLEQGGEGVRGKIVVFCDS